jgi:hypothetical protein
LAQVFLLGNRTDGIALGLDIPGNKLAVATHPSIQVDEVVDVADSANMLDYFVSLLREVLMLLASRYRLLHELFEA